MTLIPVAQEGRRDSPEDAVVLVVDDYQDCREMYAAYLALSGFKVLKARDGHEALDVVRASVPDLILMDLSLPGMDGCEVTRRLKSDPATRDVPVVALTAQSLPSFDVLRAVGFESMIIKPCLPDSLAARVAVVIAAHRRRDASRA
jgi:CheY-like chemotaxis protein